MSKIKRSTVEIAEELAMPVINELGLQLWDIRFEKEGSNWYLRYFIDKEGGLSIDDCENMSRAVSLLLDELDPISQKYILEVGSPGIERKLTKDEHFDQYIGESILVRFIRPVEGKRDYIGTLVEKDGPNITVELDDELEMTFELKETSYVQVYFDFESGGKKK